jgi:hypothetical protein
LSADKPVAYSNFVQKGGNMPKKGENIEIGAKVMSVKLGVSHHLSVVG